MPKQPAPPKSFFQRLQAWQQAVVIAAGIGSLVATVLVAGASFERGYGILAGQLGFARKIEHLDLARTLKSEQKLQVEKIAVQLERIQLWQLYDQIKRLTRQIEVLESRPLKKLSDVERDQLRDIKVQLGAASDDYKELSKKVKAAVPGGG